MTADLETRSCQCAVILVSWFICQAVPFHDQGQAISGDLSAMLLSRWKESEDVFQSDHCGSQMTCFKSISKEWLERIFPLWVINVLSCNQGREKLIKMNSPAAFPKLLFCVGNKAYIGRRSSTGALFQPCLYFHVLCGLLKVCFLRGKLRCL